METNTIILIAALVLAFMFFNKDTKGETLTKDEVERVREITVEQVTEKKKNSAPLIVGLVVGFLALIALGVLWYRSSSYAQDLMAKLKRAVYKQKVTEASIENMARGDDYRLVDKERLRMLADGEVEEMARGIARGVSSYSSFDSFDF